MEELQNSVIVNLRRLMYLKEIKRDTLGWLERKAIRSFFSDHKESFNECNPDIHQGSPDELLLPALDTYLSDLISSGTVAVLEKVESPEVENSRLRSLLSSKVSSEFPVQIAMAILEQETHLNWYRKDGYPLVGLDYNDSSDADRITSRGFFFSQRTLFEYPITQDTLNGMDDLDADMEFFFKHLRNKYENYVVSSSARARDDLRYSVEELRDEPLRGCKFSEGSMQRCVECVKNLSTRDYHNGEGLLPNGRWPLKSTKYHNVEEYLDAPDFSDFPCDYLFAIRRYNGSGINSFHYLMKVLNHLSRM